MKKGPSRCFFFFLPYFPENVMRLGEPQSHVVMKQSKHEGDLNPRQWMIGQYIINYAVLEISSTCENIPHFFRGHRGDWTKDFERHHSDSCSQKNKHTV